MTMRRATLLCLIFACGMVGGVQAQSEEEKQILATLETLYAAYPKRDAATLNRIYHQDLIYTHSSGSMDDKTAHLADVLQKRIWESVAITSSTIRVSGSAAVVRAVMDIRNGPSADRLRTDAGRNVTLFLLKGAAGWQVVLRQ